MDLVSFLPGPWQVSVMTLVLVFPDSCQGVGIPILILPGPSQACVLILVLVLPGPWQVSVMILVLVFPDSCQGLGIPILISPGPWPETLRKQ